ncbi:hypothetical protein MNBD_GAMMA09-1041 [hydrothermal vent metagenome]|uniref:Uncharacterized protein n=1 Tax=hydrothermal vent metagenome TaxID=652676 RepID=A0A3B0YIX6_9ZZZZ
MRGAGGTSGGLGHFFLGLTMLCGGIYLLLNSIIVTSNFGFGMRLYGMGQIGVTSGMVLIPFMFGVGMIFYNAKNLFGWLLAGGSLVALIFGVLSSIQFSMRLMSSFDLILILILTVGGLGLFLRSLKALDEAYPD